MLQSNSSASMQAQGVNSVNTRFNPSAIDPPLIGKNKYSKPPDTTQDTFSSRKGTNLPSQIDQSLVKQHLNAKRFKQILGPLKEIRKYIEFRGTSRDEIPYFLQTNNQLIPLIHSSIQIIKEFFPISRLSAELFSDLESEDQNQNIVIYIKTSLSVEETIKSFEEFDDKCGNNLYLKSGRKVLVMEEF